MGAAGTRYKVVMAGEGLGINCCAPNDCECMGEGGEAHFENHAYVTVEKPHGGTLRVIKAQASTAPLDEVISQAPSLGPIDEQQVLPRALVSVWPQKPAPKALGLPVMCKAPRVPRPEHGPREQPARCFLPADVEAAEEAGAVGQREEEETDVLLSPAPPGRSRQCPRHEPEAEAPGARMAAADASAEAAELAAELTTEYTAPVELFKEKCEGQSELDEWTEEGPAYWAPPDDEPEPIPPVPVVQMSESGFQPWSGGLIRQVQEDHQEAASALVQEILPLLLGECNGAACSCNCSSWNEGAAEVQGEPCNRSAELCGLGHLRAPLQKIANRPRPLELLLLSLAYVHLLRVCSGRNKGSPPSHAPKTLNSRHPCVEAFFLKYTCLKSRAALRRELEAWCPPSAFARLEDGRFNLRAVPGSGACEGPDEVGLAVDFDLLAAFIVTHSGHREVLENLSKAWEEDKNIPAPTASLDFQPPGELQLTLELALDPLLGGSMGIADDGLGPDVEVSAAARNARHAARCAATTALSSNSKSSEELFGRAATLARLLVMHLTGDVRRWRGFSPPRRRIVRS